MAMERDDQHMSSIVSFSVEERLRHVRECCRLLEDFFTIQAEATFADAPVSLSMDAYNALSRICGTCAEDLERLVSSIPPPLANWHQESTNHV
jgi:hypothetical protein